MRKDTRGQTPHTAGKIHTIALLLLLMVAFSAHGNWLEINLGGGPVFFDQSTGFRVELGFFGQLSNLTGRQNALGNLYLGGSFGFARSAPDALVYYNYGLDLYSGYTFRFGPVRIIPGFALSLHQGRAEDNGTTTLESTGFGFAPFLRSDLRYEKDLTIGLQLAYNMHFFQPEFAYTSGTIRAVSLQAFVTWAIF